MRWVSTIHEGSDLGDAAASALVTIRRALRDAPVDLVLIFATGEHGEGLRELGRVFRQELAGATVVGCTGGGVLGDGRELESGHGLAVLAGSLPGVQIASAHVPWDRLPGLEDVARWDEMLGLDGEAEPQLVILSDPFTSSPDALLASLDARWPMSPKIGGLASSGREPGENTLWLDDHVYDSGNVVLALTGDVRIDPLVAQGCRPVGDPMFITRCDRHILWELDGRTAVEALDSTFTALSPEDQSRARQALFLGLAMRPEERYGRGDYLIRHLLGTDAERGLIAVGANLRAGTVAQFHVRDRETSAEDLRLLLYGYQAWVDQGRATPAAALLFTCAGRGQRLYGEPDHDSGMIRATLGEQLPLAGFFGAGELGPVQGRTYLHGYTSAVGLIRPR